MNPKYDRSGVPNEDLTLNVPEGLGREQLATADHLADLRGAARHHFVATTVELLTTGVDVPAVRNIALFRYVRSPIAFCQMVGRGI